MKTKIFIFPALIVLLVTLLISCSRPADKLQEESVEFGTYRFTREEVAVMLFTNGISTSNLFLTDSDYVSPSEKWISSTYSSKLTKFLFDYNLNHWIQESSDCDDIAKTSAVLGSILFHNSKNRPAKTGFLFGEFHYLTDQGGGHAINILITSRDGEYKVNFYEPQKKFIVKLSNSEKKNALFTRF